MDHWSTGGPTSQGGQHAASVRRLVSGRPADYIEERVGLTIRGDPTTLLIQGERFMWKQVLALGLSAAAVMAAPSHIRSEDGCGCSPLETEQWTFDIKECQASVASAPIRFFAKQGVPDGWVIGRVRELSEAAPRRPNGSSTIRESSPARTPMTPGSCPRPNTATSS
jgi:hypothetical protein